MHAYWIVRIRKKCCGIGLAGLVVLLGFGGGKPSAARAQEPRIDTPAKAWTDSPIGKRIVSSRDLPPHTPTPIRTGAIGSPLIHDAFYPPNRPATSTALGAIGSHAPGRYDTSAFMTGTVAIGVILPQSTGPASTEHWDLARENQVATELSDGALRWVAWGNDHGANLDWTMEFNFGVPTTHEPITMKSVGTPGQCDWIPEVMTNLGFPGSDCFEQVQDYINDLRNRNHTNWAFAIFVVDSKNDADGSFTDGYFGYAYIGGPFIMMTYNNDGWGIDNMDSVVQHEMAHIFLAADTYYAPGYGGCTNNTDPYGYLGIPNSNCEIISEDPLVYNPDADTDVLMTDSNPNRVHWTTLDQVGWRDSDGDLTPDVMDTQPVLYNLNPYSPNPSSVNHLVYGASVYDNPFPHVPGGGAYDDITINTIASVEYRVDGGSWHAAAPSDGLFDTDYEYFWFDTGPLTIGPHTVEVRAKNSVNNYSAIWSDAVTIVAPVGAFQKSGPADGTLAAIPPTLSWEASSVATGYEYCLNTRKFDGCEPGWVSVGTDTSVILSGLTNNRAYYWQVRAIVPDGTIEADAGTWWIFVARSQRFADVPIDHQFWAYIEAMYTSGVTTGCGVSPLIYCPDSTVTRAAMAAFLLRAKYGAGYAPPAASHFFSDLPVAGKEWQEAWVDQFYLEGITTGCGTDPLLYCPEQSVTRAAMAVFILRAKYGSSYAPPAASHFFADLPVAGKEWMEPWVDELYREGITTGCGTGPLIYCPETAVKRQAMAAFIVRAFNLPMP